MADDSKVKSGRTPGLPAPKRDKDIGGLPQSLSAEDAFRGDFEHLKLNVVRPAFEAAGARLAERGFKFNITEEPGGKISIHLVPAGAKQSIHPFDWFPTFSLFGAPFDKTVGVHGRNMRPNSEASSGNRGDYKLPQVSKEMVDKELMKFVGEIANW